MKKVLLTVVAIMLQSCFATKDLSQTLRFADNKSVSVSQLKLQELQKMKKGTACSYSLLFIPLIGSSSLLDAADSGKVNQIQLIGETGFWVFPILRNCTVVYGDAPNIENVVAPRQ